MATKKRQKEANRREKKRKTTGNDPSHYTHDTRDRPSERMLDRVMTIE